MACRPNVVALQWQSQQKQVQHWCRFSSTLVERMTQSLEALVSPCSTGMLGKRVEPLSTSLACSWHQL